MPERRAATHGHGERDAAIASFLQKVMLDISSSPNGSVDALRRQAVPGRVFDILTSRDFCYLSKSRVAAYREHILRLIAGAVHASEPIPFFYDLGGGYHAATSPGKDHLSFDVGLAELLVLRQVSSFAAKVRHVYVPGVTFTIVIDNVAALLINDIPIEKTVRYCERFRELIRQAGMSVPVDVLVESEHFTAADLQHLIDADAGRWSRPQVLTRQQHANVERFLGRVCSAEEALERAARYQPVIEASERLLERLISGVHATQRASDTTICFRPFRGGDSRIQSGEVVLTRNTRGTLHPILLTSQKTARYSLSRHRFPELLPPVIPHVTYAGHVD
jgi:hypothetical protein